MSIDNYRRLFKHDEIPHDPALIVDSAVCSDTWEPAEWRDGVPLYDMGARKEHLEGVHPYWVTCERCHKTWRYANWWSWEGKYEAEQLCGHKVEYGDDSSPNAN